MRASAETGGALLYSVAIREKDRMGQQLGFEKVIDCFYEQGRDLLMDTVEPDRESLKTYL